MGEMDNPYFMVEASTDEVERILKAELSSEQLSQIGLTTPSNNGLDGNRRIVGAEDLITTTCIAIAGNASYELLKVVGLLLVTKLGKDKVLKLREKNSSDD